MAILNARPYFTNLCQWDNIIFSYLRGYIWWMFFIVCIWISVSFCYTLILKTLFKRNMTFWNALELFIRNLWYLLLWMLSTSCFSIFWSNEHVIIVGDRFQNSDLYPAPMVFEQDELLLCHTCSYCNRTVLLQ